MAISGVMAIAIVITVLMGGAIYAWEMIVMACTIFLCHWNWFAIYRMNRELINIIMNGEKGK